MNKIYQKSFPGEKNAGFTLIELLVVVLIIGILAAVALPQYEKAVEKSRAVQAFTYLDAWVKAQQIYYLANGTYLNAAPKTLWDAAGIEEPEYNQDLFEYSYYTNFSGDLDANIAFRRDVDGPEPEDWDYLYELVVFLRKDGTIIRQCRGYIHWCKVIASGAGECSSHEGSPQDSPWCYTR